MLPTYYRVFEGLVKGIDKEITDSRISVQHASWAELRWQPAPQVFVQQKPKPLPKKRGDTKKRQERNYFMAFRHSNEPASRVRLLALKAAENRIQPAVSI
ncbi:hypothetical protein LPB67_17535 [Undibacterium sp. Jales W-56]|uniref:hypothetical protein n=1 Tax=Undibacterium sp. Jales W-56 TaxID=2897325 RepID=UPI0021D23CDD|nr:hypothetical protein [Undibacterium sp. Jales W-56]MCU6435584.1 hypothetical protein [Undibacterium sp. Jales W-56]